MLELNSMQGVVFNASHVLTTVDHLPASGSTSYSCIYGLSVNCHSLLCHRPRIGVRVMRGGKELDQFTPLPQDAGIILAPLKCSLHQPHQTFLYSCCPNRCYLVLHELHKFLAVRYHRTCRDGARQPRKSGCVRFARSTLPKPSTSNGTLGPTQRRNPSHVGSVGRVL